MINKSHLVLATLDHTVQFNYSSDIHFEQSSVQYINLSFNFNVITYLKTRDLFLWINLVTILIGLVGNFFSFLVLINPKLRTTTNIFLANLCLSSFIALFGQLINSIIYQITYFYGPSKAYLLISLMYPYVYPITNTFQLACIILTVCVSVNKFLCIYSSKMKNFSKMSAQTEYNKSIKTVLVVYVLSTLYCIPYWLKFEYTEQGLHVTRIGRSNEFNKIVHFWMYLPIVYLIPFSILIITNSYLLAKLMIAKRRRTRLGIISARNSNFKNEAQAKGRVHTSRVKSSSNNKSKIEIKSSLNRRLSRAGSISLSSEFSALNKYRKEISVSKSFKDKREETKRSNKLGRTKVTCMLVAVVFLFFICQFPNLIIHILESLNTNRDFEKSAWYNYGLIISKFLIIINLSFNFSCYCLFSEQFREVLYEIFIFKRN